MKKQNFLTRNTISDMAGLKKHFSGMIDKPVDIRDKLKPIERRLISLEKHVQIHLMPYPIVHDKKVDFRLSTETKLTAFY